MIYFTSGKTSHDPMRSMFSHGDGIALTYAPRPEFNNHNPILVRFRSRDYRDEKFWHARDWALNLDDRPTFGRYTQAERDHARRVLTKLANLYGDTNVY